MENINTRALKNQAHIHNPSFKFSQDQIKNSMHSHVTTRKELTLEKRMN
jgi:hypothetical protein